MSYDQAMKWSKMHPRGTRQPMVFSTGTHWPAPWCPKCDRHLSECKCGKTTKARQTEMPIDGGYKLLVQTADDGDRINREQTEARAIMERIERAQVNLPIIETTPRAI